MIDLKTAKTEQVMLTGNTSFKCYHYRVSIDDAMPLHRHDEWELSWIIKGTGHHVIGDQLESAYEQEVILLPPNMPHCWIFDNNKEGYTENITIQFADSLISQLNQLKEMSFLGTYFHTHSSGIEIKGDDADRLRSLLKSMEEKDDFDRLLIFIHILRTISSIQHYRTISSSSASGTDFSKEKIDRIQKVYCYISSNYSNPIRLKDVADVACLSETSFCTFFKDITRHRFSDYLCHFRIEMAANMLIHHPDTPISHICYDAGFNDIPHFNRMFRRIKGCTPSEYTRKWNHDV